MMKLLEKFYPDERRNSVYEIDFDSLYRKGIRGLIFDIDNTLVPHGASATEGIERLFNELKRMGFKTCLLSRLINIERTNIFIEFFHSL